MPRPNGGGNRRRTIVLIFVGLLCLVGGIQFHFLQTISERPTQRVSQPTSTIQKTQQPDSWDEEGTTNPPPSENTKNHKPELSDSHTEKDLQLFIIWNGAMKHSKKIITDLESDKNFEIYKKITWTHNHDTYKEDLWRLYWGKGGLKQQGMSKKVQQCGGPGKSIILLVVDKNPKYGNVETAHGTDYVSKNMHTAKYKYRKMSGGGFKVHGTYSMAESEHDSFVLFGLTASQLLNNPEAVESLEGSTFSFSHWPSCELLYKSLALITTIDKINPPLSDCQQHSSGQFSLSAGIPETYDKTLNIKAALISMVHGTGDDEEGWITSVTEGDHDFDVKFTVEN